jgi:hypothetical protein
MPSFKRFFRTLIALIFLAIFWIWDRLHPIIRWIIDYIPLAGLKRAVARFMEQLSPYPTLLIFLIPLIAVEPGKIFALWLIAKGQWLLGVATYIFVDVLRLGLLSFLFNTSRDKLLSIDWFRRLYLIFVRAHDWARAQIAPLKEAIAKVLRDAGFVRDRGSLWRGVVILWRHARKGGFRGV